MARLGRRTLMMGLGALAVAGTAEAEPRRDSFEVVEKELILPGLDPRHDGIVVAHVTDVHLGASTPDSRVTRAIAAVNARRPDLVALTGDYVTLTKGPIARLGDRLSGFEAPTFAVLGNHDHWVDAGAVSEALQGNGYDVLANVARRIELRGAPLWVVGVDDAQVGKEDIPRAFERVPATGSRIVLAHQPNSANRLPLDSHLLCLSGHTHGGQIVIPGITQRIANTVGQPYLKGLFQVRGNLLFVSAGIGYGRGGPAVRVRNPPEIAFLTLRA